METLSAFSLPPGFGFHPTDVELVSHYLKRKSLGLQIDFEVIPEVDIYKHEPWDLPAKCHIPTRDSKWHFFTARDRKYPNGSRSNRATEAGYWKSTGKDRIIKSGNRVIGSKKTLVFHQGRPPSGKRTDWIMHEYYLDEEYKASPGLKDTFVLCRVTKRDGLVQEADVSSEIVGTDDGPKQQTHVAEPAVPKESPSPSDNIDDFEEWFTELYDPNFCAVPDNTEPKEDGIFVAPKQEVSEDTFVLLPENDQMYSFPETEFLDFNSDMLGEYGTCMAIEDLFPLDDNTIQCMDGSISKGEDTKQAESKEETGIQLRQRPAEGYTTRVINCKIKLQVHKMEFRKEGTIINKTLVPAEAFSTVKPEIKEEIVYGKATVSELQPFKNQNKGTWSAECIQGILSGTHLFLGGSSSASWNILFIVATVALVICFLLRDSGCFYGVFNGLGL